MRAGFGRALLAAAAALLLVATRRPCRRARAQARRHRSNSPSRVEPDNYDCHANTSFAFLHPIAPHYSTLLKFDAANYPQIVGDLAQSWTRLARRPHLHLQAAAERPLPRRLEADLGRREGELRAHRPPAAGRRLGAAGRLRRDLRRSIRPIRSPSSSTCNGRTRRCWRISPRRGTASTARPSSPRTRNSRRLTSSAPAPSSSSSTSRASTGRASAATNISSPAGPISTAIRPIS